MVDWQIDANRPRRVSRTWVSWICSSYCSQPESARCSAWAWHTQPEASTHRWRTAWPGQHWRSGCAASEPGCGTVTDHVTVLVTLVQTRKRRTRAGVTQVKLHVTVAHSDRRQRDSDGSEPQTVTGMGRMAGFRLLCNAKISKSHLKRTSGLLGKFQLKCKRIKLKKIKISPDPSLQWLQCAAGPGAALRCQWARGGPGGGAAIYDILCQTSVSRIWVDWSRIERLPNGLSFKRLANGLSSSIPFKNTLENHQAEGLSEEAQCIQGATLKSTSWLLPRQPSTVFGRRISTVFQNTDIEMKPSKTHKIVLLLSQIKFPNFH